MPDHNADSSSTAAAVQFSNATSSLFLGTAPRSWMVNGAGGAVQPQPARQYSNATPKRPRPQRIKTTIPAGPPGGGSPIVIAPRPCSSHASANLTRESRLVTATTEVNENVRQQATLHTLGVPHMAANEPTAHAHQGQPVSASNSLDMYSPPVVGGAGIDDLPRVPVSVQPSATNLNTRPGTGARDNFQAETLTLGGDNPGRLFTFPSPETILPPHPPPTNASPQESDPYRSSCTQGASRADRGALSNPSTRHHFAAIGATPPADADNSDSRGKRVADATLSEERRTRARASVDMLDHQLQLPTPQDSPITSNMATLSEKFESALAAMTVHPPTIDPRLVIDSRRVEMMRDACRLNDFFFLLVHNLFCLWSLGRKDILEQLRFTEMHFQGMQILVQILGPNQHVTVGLSQIFLTFPRPPEALLQDKSRGFMSLVEDVRCFLYHLTSGFATLRDTALKRRCPPCPAEFKFSLKLPSPALQKALFLSILRRTFSDQYWLRQAVSLFSTEMDNPAGSAISIAELNAYHGKQLEEIVSRWSHVYAQQLMEYQAGGNAGMAIPPAGGQQSVDAAQTYHSNGPISGSLEAHANTHNLAHPPRSLSLAPAQYISQPSDPPFRSGQFIPTSSSPIQFSTQPSHPPDLLTPQQQSYATTLRTHPLATPWTPGLGNVSANFLGPPQTTYSNPHSQGRRNGNNPGQALPNQCNQASPGTPATAPMGPMRLPASGDRAPVPDWEKLTIVGERQRGGRTEFRIRWNGSNIPNDSWLPETQLQNAQGQIAAFRARMAATNTHGNRQRDRSLPSPGRSTTQIRQPIASPDSMPSTFIQQQRGHGPQLVSNLEGQQSPPSQQAAHSVRHQQYPAATQSPQAPSYQQRPAYHTPANAHGSPWTPAMQVPPNAQQVSNPPTLTGVSASARPNSTRAPATAQPQPITRPEATVNSPYRMTPPTLPATRPPQSATTHPGQPQQHAVPQQVLPFFHPDPDFVLAQMAVPNPDFLALHQAGLRSPEYHKMVDLDGNESDARYYQYVEDIIELPQFITRDSDLVRWNVHIPQQIWSRRATPLAPFGEFLTPQRRVAAGNVQFRLKAVNFAEKRGRAKPTVSEFCTQPTKWPKCLSVSINEHHAVDFRRKAHYGVDLATDITEMVRERDNEIVVGAIFTPQEAELKFLIAVEIICVADYQRLLKMPTRIPAADALAAITDLLKKGDDDDDLVMDRTMSIDLVDPFTSVMWVTPVRGSDCRHLECFDLEVFLASRVKDSGLSSPDKWHCPICKSDCRPPMLVIDEFLLGVRKTLEENGQLPAKAKAIVVRDDGTWEPRLEQASKDEGRDTPDPNTSNAATPAPAVTGPTAAHAAPSASTTSRTIDTRTVIILDDDGDD